MTWSGSRAQCTCSTSRSAPWRSSSRSIAQIGVTPLPALMNSARSGSGSGSRNSPSTSPRNTIAPGSTRRVNHGDISPASTCLTVIDTSPPGWSGSDVSE